MRLARNRLPIRKLVGVRIRIVKEAALLDEQPARMHARPIAAVPAERALSDCLLQRGDRLRNLLALLRRRERGGTQPAPAVATDIEAGGADCLRRLRIALERKRAAEHRHWKLALLEQAHQPPERDAAAVFEHAFR